MTLELPIRVCLVVAWLVNVPVTGHGGSSCAGGESMPAVAGDVAKGASDVASDAAVGAGNVAGDVAGPIPRKAGEVAGSAEMAAKAAVMGALNLYLDFINMFTFLLQLFGSQRE